MKLWQAVHGLGMMGVSRGDTNYVVRLLREKTTDVTVDENQALLAIIGSGIGIGTAVAERFFAILEQLTLAYTAVITGELFLKVLCPASRIKIAMEEIHNDLIKENQAS